jgi:hypothetical protein
VRLRDTKGQALTADRSHFAQTKEVNKVGNHRPLTSEDFWKIPAHQEMKKFGMTGFKGDRPSCLWFDLEITDFCKIWQGKLVIEWPRPPIRWWRWAKQNKFPIHPILQDSVLHPSSGITHRL